MAFSENLSDFLLDFAVPATIGTATVNGILHREFVDVTTQRGVINGYRPTFDCAAADLPEIERGDTVTIGGDEYEYVMQEPDGTGLTKLILKEAE
jgi:hypothetical protein